MIKETCSCGASFEVDYVKQPAEEVSVAIWRANHRHEPQTVARDAPKVQPTHYLDWVAGETGWVWVGNGPMPQFAPPWPPPPPVPTAQPGYTIGVRPAQYDTT